MDSSVQEMIKNIQKDGSDLGVATAVLTIKETIEDLKLRGDVSLEEMINVVIFACYTMLEADGVKEYAKKLKEEANKLK